MTLPQALRPDPDQARAWLEAELSRPEYQESIQERLQRWLSDLLSGVTPGRGVLGWLGILLVLACLVAVILALTRMRIDRRVKSADEPRPLGDPRMTADDHRRLAGEALQRNDLAEALVHAFRAAAARGRERGEVPIPATDTADEAARRLTVSYPAESAVLAGSARLFDATRYGTRIPTRAEVEGVLELEERLRHARTAERAAVGTPPGPPAPPQADAP